MGRQRKRRREDRASALEAELAQLRAEVTDLRARVDAPALVGEASTDSAAQVLSRRGLITAAGAALAGGVAGTLLSVAPASATSGAMQYGASQDAGTTPTQLDSTNSTNTLLVRNLAAGVQAPAIQGVATSTKGLAILGFADGSGGGSSAIGVKGHAPNAAQGIGVYGVANNFVGVKGEIVDAAQPGAGVLGQTASALAFGVVGLNTAGGAGVLAEEPTAGAGGKLRIRAKNTTVTGVDFGLGTMMVDNGGDLYISHAYGSGLPGGAGWTFGSFRRVSNPPGALNLLSAPRRVYDSRPGEAPTAIGVKAPITTGVDRVIDANLILGLDLKPSALLLTVTVVNTVTSGYLSVRATGTAAGTFSSMNWYQSGQVVANSVVSAVQVVPGGPAPQYNFTVHAGGPGSTDFLVDVVGLYW